MRVRSAKAGESQNLAALCVRSKAHWGYDAAFMKLSEAALVVNEDDIRAGRVLVAVDDAGHTTGTFVVPGIEDLQPAVAGGGAACEITGKREHGKGIKVGSRHAATHAAL